MHGWQLKLVWEVSHAFFVQLIQTIELYFLKNIFVFKWQYCICSTHESLDVYMTQIYCHK